MADITRQECKIITDEVQKAVAEIFARHHLAPPTMKAKYGFKYTVTAETTRVELNDTGVNLSSVEATAYTTLASVYGLQPGLLGKTLVYKGVTYRFEGIAVKRSKYPFKFVAVNGDKPGQTMYFPEGFGQKLNEAS